MATNNEFGLITNFREFSDTSTRPDDVAVHAIRDGKRVVGWMPREMLPRASGLVDKWKLLIPKSYGERGTIPAQILGPTLVVDPPSVSTQTYVFVYVDNEAEAQCIQHYAKTRFFRFLLSLRKITQHAAKPVYTWVPQQAWDRMWTDAELYKKYDITPEETAFIESMIRPMNGSSE